MQQDRLRLHLNSMGTIQGDDSVCIVIMVEETNKMQLAFVTDDDMRRQLSLRLHKPEGDTRLSKLLPEVMWETMRGFSEADDYEMMIESVGENGEYNTTLRNKILGVKHDIRLSDAVLLQEVADIPLYINISLVKQQMMPYHENSNSTALPINIMPMAVLEKGLADCLAKEDYRMAQRLKNEINKRKTFNNNKGGETR